MDGAVDPRIGAREDCPAGQAAARAIGDTMPAHTGETSRSTIHGWRARPPGIRRFTMSLKHRLTAFAVVIAAVGVGGPVGLAGAATGPGTDPVVAGPSCPDGYDGPTNLATGCPYWTMSYTVAYPGKAPVRMPPGWTPPSAG
jgi:hypothetical protein